MGFERLRAILSPPREVIPPSDQEWKSAETKLGTSFPKDYRCFIDSYGSGIIAGFMHVFSPFAKLDSLNLFWESEYELAAIRSLPPGNPKWNGRALFPEPGGLLPWGSSDNGNVFWWITKGESDQWSVAIDIARGPEIEEYDESMTSLVEGILSRRIKSAILPDPFPEGTFQQA